MKKLILERRGCDFWPGETRTAGSDIGNFRVCTPAGVLVPGKDGRSYILEFTHWERYRYRTTHKRTGAPLKHPVKELVNINALHIDTQYDDDRGSWRNLELEQEIHAAGLDYTRAGILAAVNMIAAEPYTEIEIRRR